MAIFTTNYYIIYYKCVICKAHLSSTDPSKQMILTLIRL